MIQLIREGKKVSAIKKAREVLGMSLVEAKQYVDNLEAK
ncbi:ribosomal protein L7/L12 [Paenibacillus alvei]|uniref:Ribosomal protein L7/L12 n=1 Tax=Paenibacillus alvei TaxID=44250 RepID=A0ABT4GVC1_PAEAL|nr:MULTISPECIES: ribosomal protein L7/L12 [Paenibacillus]MCY9541411.1 ribosomal protein L7/L12 [Paenibacillus alvei]MCY9702682.1 ribosomal protein L7/L12 [Paenibacillus alvei]MCY9733066.1 ribosomal protein L7/L12 [Paenibacillus alvei]MCY9756446.1 ribosomal protein L7/L12 [Paenibacillus alvei]MCY9760658.1 ribosomal protein L7/L12 [Paenibacillus alvei]